MSTPNHRFSAVLVGAALLLLGGAGAAVAQKVGAQAPALVGQTVDGKPFDLAKLRGHGVVANVWATWCPPCRAEMPMLDAFYKAHQGQGIVLIGLSADRTRDEATVQRVMSAFSYPAVILKAAKTDGFTPPNVLPVTYVIDAGGTVRAALVYTDKPLNEADLTAAIAKAERR
jgi:cytochrome c biogenesis protein CcmG/thiol:disulfide interchange protein DsbE